MSHEQEKQNSLNVWDSSEMVRQWQSEVELRQRNLGKATRQMLEAADLKPGHRVLDIAAGTGDQSILAARIVGPEGTVLATDISAEMLKVATQVAQQQGLTTITTQVMNAEQLELADNTFDAVICRYGLMFVPDLKSALSEIHRVLKPGRKLAALVWSKPDRNPLFSVPRTIVTKYYAGASSQIPNVFSLADPTILEQGLKEAGFNEVVMETIPFRFRYASLEAFMQASSKRTLTVILEQLSQQDQQRLQAEIRGVLQQFESPSGLDAPGEALLAVGRRP